MITHVLGAEFRVAQGKIWIPFIIPCPESSIEKFYWKFAGKLHYSSKIFDDISF